MIGCRMEISAGTVGLQKVGEEHIPIYELERCFFMW